MKTSFTQPGGVASLTATDPGQPATALEVAATVEVGAPGAPAPAGAVAIRPPSAVATPMYSDDAGDIPDTDLVIQRLNIVQKVGDMSNNFTHGSIVYNAQNVLVEGAKGENVITPGSIRLVIAGFKPTRFVEKLEGGAQGFIFDSEAEVAAKNGTLDWNESKATGKQLYERLATALIVIEKPATDNSTDFQIPLDGKQYALALYSMKGTGYTNACKPFKTARKIGALKQGYRNAYWTMQTVLRKSKQGNFYYAPVVNVKEQTTDKFRADLSEFLGF